MTQSWQRLQGLRGLRDPAGKMDWSWLSKLNNTYVLLKCSMQGLELAPESKVFSNRKKERLECSKGSLDMSKPLYDWREKLLYCVLLIKERPKSVNFLIYQLGSCIQKKGYADFRKCQKLLGWWRKWRVNNLAYFPRQAKAEKGHNSLKTHVRHSIPAKFAIVRCSLRCHVLKRLL